MAAGYFRIRLRKAIYTNLGIIHTASVRFAAQSVSHFRLQISAASAMALPP